MKIILLALTIFTVQSQADISQADLQRYFDLSYKTAVKPNAAESDPQVLPLYQNTYAKKLDFARLEHTKPLDKAFLKKLTVKDMMSMDAELADQLYARLSAGPIPDGLYEGEAAILKGSPFLEIARVFTRDDETTGIIGLLNKAGLNVGTADRFATMINQFATAIVNPGSTIKLSLVFTGKKSASIRVAK